MGAAYPQWIPNDAWYYEERDGIYLVVGKPGHVETVKIPWSMLRRSLTRKDKRKLPRKSPKQR